MSFDDIREACEDHLATNWSDTTIAYDNVKFDIPTSAWIRCFLRPVSTENSSIGGLSKRNYASFWIQIFTPLNSGTGLAYDYAEKLEVLFSNITLNGIVFYAAETIRVGDEGNGWYQLNVRAECWAQSNC